MAPEPVAGLPDPQADPAVAVGAGLAFSLAATRSGRLFFSGRLGHGGVVAGAAASGNGNVAGAGAGAAPGSLAAAAFTELPLLAPSADDPAPGERFRIACGLHHALVSLAAARPGELPRLWRFGISRAGALGTGLTVDARLAPAEVDLAALLAAHSGGGGGGSGGAGAGGAGGGSGATSASSLDRELPVACGPYSSAFALRGRVFLAGRLDSPLLLGAAGSNAALAAGKSADERSLMRDLGLLGEDEIAIVDALEAADGGGSGSIVARSFVPVLEEGGTVGGRGRVAALSLGSAHAATLELA
jgi:hypothetical protein